MIPRFSTVEVIYNVGMKPSFATPAPGDTVCCGELLGAPPVPLPEPRTREDSTASLGPMQQLLARGIVFLDE